MEQHYRGFSLIELMIVLAIAGVLVSLVYPGYQEYVHRSRRADAQAALVSLAQQLEGCYSRRFTYEDCVAFPVVSSHGFYRITADSLDQSSFVLRASPVVGTPATSDRRCSQFKLLHSGHRQAFGSAADPDSYCW